VTPIGPGVRIWAGGPADRAFLEAMLREAALANEPSISVPDAMARPDLAITIPEFHVRAT